MEIGSILASGWASGLNLYGTALLIGLAGRLGWADTPDGLQGTAVLAVFGVLFLVEFVVDKVPWLDSAWDVAHTVIRPLGGALLGGFLAHDAGSSEVLAAMLSGTFALTAHSAKATTRAVANTSPEPVSNIALSLGEDGVVAGVVALALAYPVAAGIVAVSLALACVVATWFLWRTFKRIRGAWRRRLRPST
jgi:hypothetical protein